MAIKRELIQFTIVNSTDCDYNIPMFQQNVYSVNATTKYSWDVTTAVLSCGTGTIVVNSITYPLTYAATLTGLLSALNALGFGFFCTETVSGSTYIYVVDDTNVYGDLDLCPSGITTTTTTTTTTAGTTTSTTTSTTTGVPTTSTTSTTTTVPTTSTTSTTTTGVPTTSTTSTTTTVPTTSTTSTTTTGVPTTSTTSTTTTDVPTTSTTSTTTTVPETSTTTTTSTTTAPETSTTTTTSTTTAPETSTTTTTTTVAPTTTTTSTTTSTTTLFENLFFDANAGAGGYTITAIDVNGVTPTLVSGTNVPFNTDGHGFNTTQTGSNQTLNLSITVVLNGCITVTDSASNVSQQNINSSGNYAFTGLVINNTTAVQVSMADNAC